MVKSISSEFPADYQSTKSLGHSILRVSKADSSFLYFVLEACDGVCFYSTLDDDTGDRTDFRDIDIYFPPEQSNEFLNILNHLSQHINLSKLKMEFINDH